MNKDAYLSINKLIMHSLGLGLIQTCPYQSISFLILEDQTFSK